MSAPTEDAVREALGRVIDPELHRSITDLGMVESVEISESGAVSVGVLLTVAGCPLKDTITEDTRREVGGVEGVTEVSVHLGVMTDEQKAELRTRLRGAPRNRSSPHPAGQSHARVRGDLRQGRGGQVLGDRQPRGGHGGPGPERGRRRRRHLRLLHPPACSAWTGSPPSWTA